MKSGDIRVNEGQKREDTAVRLQQALWRIYNRAPARPWQGGGNLPWDDPAFSARMLREHLDESHGAASRKGHERAAQLTWLWESMPVHPDAHVLDVTCGPGLYAVALAERGCQVTGIDFGPAAIAYARELAAASGVAKRCTFLQQDVREMVLPPANFDAALLLYGQLAVFERSEAQALLATIAAALKPGATLAVELLNQARVDKADSTWWYTDDTGLWGERPFLHLGERTWLPEEALSVERFQILDLESGALDEIVLCDQTYRTAEMGAMLREAGFSSVEVYPAWDGLPLYDAPEWHVYLARR